jgi:hypothetical protein
VSNAAIVAVAAATVSATWTAALLPAYRVSLKAVLEVEDTKIEEWLGLKNGSNA